MAFIPTQLAPPEECPSCGWHPIDCRCADDAELASEAEAQSDDEGET